MIPWHDALILLRGSCITENDLTYKVCYCPPKWTVVPALSSIGIIDRLLFQMWLGDTQAFIDTEQKWHFPSL